MSRSLALGLGCGFTAINAVLLLVTTPKPEFAWNGPQAVLLGVGIGLLLGLLRR